MGHPTVAYALGMSEVVTSRGNARVKQLRAAFAGQARLASGLIAIEGEHITAVSANVPDGKREIDATGLTILPGLIDIHLHFNEPGRSEWEGAATGSRALAAGGGTLFFDMPLNSSPCTTNARHFDQKRAALEAASITDFALWGGLVPENIGDLAELADRGSGP